MSRNDFMNLTIPTAAAPQNGEVKNVSGYDAMAFQLSLNGATGGTVVLQGSLDGSTFVDLTGAITTSSITAIAASPVKFVRLRKTVDFTSGPPTAVLAARLSED